LGAALIVAGVATYAYAPNLVDQDKVTELENLADYADAAGLPYTARQYREQAGDERDQAAQGRLAGEVLVAGGLVLLGSSAERDLAGSPLKVLVPGEGRPYLRANPRQGRIECVYNVRF
jgi:hypothetical protein